MYPEKRLLFLCEACEAVKSMVPQFELIVIGAGPDAEIVKEFAATRDWVHYVGPKFGLERVPYFSVSQILLMPGLVGLSVLDSFALGTPMITTKYPFHSPEIDYLEDGENGLISNDNLTNYAQTVRDALADPGILSSLRNKGRISAQRYTVEAMVSNFAEGILKAMDAPPRDRTLAQ
jgi:glycosyltransferase involved in cell wall biosynthesis